jgi:hypothetical protein
LSFFNSNYVEELVKDVIRHQIENQVHEKIEALTATFFTARSGRVLGRTAEEFEMAQRHLKDILPEKISNIITEMRNPDCDCRLKTEKNLRQGFEWQVARSDPAQERLTILIRTKYMESAEKLLLEVRIFTASNALFFALLGLAAWRKRACGLQLLPPALALLGAAAVTAWLYWFKQDWLHTILFGDYTGFCYLAWLAMVFASLADILLNRARITSRMLNILFGLVGSSVQVLPC